MPISNYCLIMLFGLLTSLANAQTNSDIIAVDVKKSGSNFVLVEGSEKKITDRNAYDNQPNFINEKQLAFSAADETGNVDIIIYNFEANKFTNLTKTSHLSEYSPKITDCGLYVSAVTVEEDGKQRLWLYPTNFGEPELLYDDIEPVGYYDWYNNIAAMFILGQPNTLVYPFGKDDVLTISQNVGRSIHKKPKSSIITYVDKNEVEEVDGQIAFAIKGFDIEKRTVQDFGYTVPGVEDFIWLDKKRMLMGKGNELFVRKAKDKAWEKAGILDIKGYQNITRLAFSKDLKKLVTVMDRKE